MGTMKAKRAALYLRVSTGEQTIENQRQALEAAALHRGWIVTATYADEGISGAKGRDKRPALDGILKDAMRGKFDIVMSWSVDRMGRSLSDLISTLQELHSAKVDLFLHQQAIDTTTPAGRAMFAMMGVFAEFEREMIRSRVHAGLDRARANGVTLGRPKVGGTIEADIRERLATGTGMLKVARQVGVGTGTVQRIRAAMTAEAGHQQPGANP
jgi:DNA invertase Pin-like site-specific DNA recombinase